MATRTKQAMTHPTNQISKAAVLVSIPNTLDVSPSMKARVLGLVGMPRPVKKKVVAERGLGEMERASLLLNGREGVGVTRKRSRAVKWVLA